MGMPFPPREEQEKIAKHVDTKTVVFDTAISRLKREIDLLREYRTRLIADVVTGKLDVREAALLLPVETKFASAAKVVDNNDNADDTDEFEPIEEELAA